MEKWKLTKERGKWTIRSRTARLPISRYKRIQEDKALMEALVLQLNAPLRAKEAWAFKHSLITESIQEEYRDWLYIQVPNRHNAKAEFKTLLRHFLHYFIGTLELMTPDEWHRVHDTKWAAYLMSDKAPPSPKSKKAIVQAANRFVQWMHRKYPEFMPKLVFEPFSRASLKKLGADWDRGGQKAERKRITQDDWSTIVKRLPKSRWAYITPLVLLSFNYGLRRREAQGLQLTDVKKGYLEVRRQLVRLTPQPTYDSLKGREMRKTPHWFCSPKDTYRWVEAVKIITPTAYSDAWAEFMKEVGMNYVLHDLRHTYITRAVREYKHVDVMLAVGHKNIETTMAYLHDDRELEADELFDPAA